MKLIKLNKAELSKKKEIISFEYEIKKLYEEGKIKWTNCINKPL